MGASKCSQGTVNANCATEQSFCTINGQKVSQNSGISASLTSIAQNETLTDDALWNRIYTVLTNIFNYGERGTRNPLIRADSSNDKITAASQRKTNFKDQQQYTDEVLQRLYNDIVNIIPVSGINNILSNNPTISKTVMDNLQQQINNYQLNKDRCNSCNTACNTTCQASCECSGEGGQGGGGDCGIGSMTYFYMSTGNGQGQNTGQVCTGWYVV